MRKKERELKKVRLENQILKTKQWDSLQETRRVIPFFSGVFGTASNLIMAWALGVLSNGYYV